MDGLANLTIEEFQDKINNFNSTYAIDWTSWLKFENVKHVPQLKARRFGSTLRKWQACRPNKIRGSRFEGDHAPPFLEDLIEEAETALKGFNNINMLPVHINSPEVDELLKNLWHIFKGLSYSGKARNGLTGIVGISKAVLLLTYGRIGPAFDSNVRSQLGITSIDTPGEWVLYLKSVTEDIEKFEQRNGRSLMDAAPPEYRNIHRGRLYDMAFGPTINR